MDDAISIIDTLLSSESDARVVLVTMGVIVIFIIIAIALCMLLYKMYKLIHSESKKEFEKESVDEEYHKKVDETVKEIQSLAQLIHHLGEQINKSNESTKEEIQTLKTMIETQGENGCPFGQKTANTAEEEIGEIKSEVLSSLQSDISLLLESDRERIKSYITEQYHYWMNLGYIDIYSKKSIEEQYIRYKRENGNTFVTSMVEELRKLPPAVVTKNCTTARMIEESKRVEILPSDFFKDENGDGIPDIIDGEFCDQVDEVQHNTTK